MYLLSTTKNSFGLVEYDHQHSIEADAFYEYAFLKDLATKTPIIFKVAKKSAINRIANFHVVESTGPTLVSNVFRQVIEGIAPSDVEFLDVTIGFEGQKIEGFSCVHPLLSIECMDMQKSEFELTNFDPHNPTYMFSYMCLLERRDSEPGLARCAEYRQQLLVDDEIKNACFVAKLKGLAFYRAFDMTYNNRIVGEAI